MLMSHLPSPPDTVRWGKVPLLPASALACAAQGAALQPPGGPQSRGAGDAPGSSIA